MRGAHLGWVDDGRFRTSKSLHAPLEVHEGKRMGTWAGARERERGCVCTWGMLVWLFDEHRETAATCALPPFLASSIRTRCPTPMVAFCFLTCVVAMHEGEGGGRVGMIVMVPWQAEVAKGIGSSLSPPLRNAKMLYVGT